MNFTVTDPDDSQDSARSNSSTCFVVLALCAFAWLAYLLIMRFYQPPFVGSWSQGTATPWFSKVRADYTDEPISDLKLRLDPGPEIGTGELIFSVPRDFNVYSAQNKLAQIWPANQSVTAPLRWRRGSGRMRRSEIWLDLDVRAIRPQQFKPLLTDQMLFQWTVSEDRQLLTFQRGSDSIQLLRVKP